MLNNELGSKVVYLGFNTEVTAGVRSEKRLNPNIYEKNT